MHSKELENEWTFFFYPYFQVQICSVCTQTINFPCLKHHEGSVYIDCHKALLRYFRHKKSLSNLPCCNLQIRNSHRRDRKGQGVQAPSLPRQNHSDEVHIIYFYFQSLYVGFDIAKSFLRDVIRPLRYSVFNMF